MHGHIETRHQRASHGRDQCEFHAPTDRQGDAADLSSGWSCYRGGACLPTKNSYQTPKKLKIVGLNNLQVVQKISELSDIETLFSAIFFHHPKNTHEPDRPGTGTGERASRSIQAAAPRSKVRLAVKTWEKFGTFSTKTGVISGNFTDFTQKMWDFFS